MKLSEPPDPFKFNVNKLIIKYRWEIPFATCSWKGVEFIFERQNRKSTEGYSKSIFRENNDKFGKKGLVLTRRTYASPKGTGPGVWRSKRPLSACHTRRKCSMETSQSLIKGRVRYKFWSVGVCHCIWSGHRISFSIRERRTSYFRLFQLQTGNMASYTLFGLSEK